MRNLSQALDAPEGCPGRPAEHEYSWEPGSFSRLSNFDML